jgi:Cu-processing system permease protein
MAISHKELSDKLKSRWVLVIAVGFAVFTLIIAYFGSSSSGMVGLMRMDAIIASLTSLVTYFIPILALTLGGGIIADEREKGTLELFLASPVSALEFLLGKFSGLVLSLTISTLLGFGSAGLMLGIMVGGEALGMYLLFILNSIILGIVFLSISFLVSVLFNERAKAIAVTVFLWLFFTILYDLGLIGLLITTKGALDSNILTALLMLNPVDIYRMLNFISIGESSVFIGLAPVDMPAILKLSTLWAACALWILAPLGFTYYFFKRRYLR